MDDSYIEVLKWVDIRDEVAKINPSLVHIIDKINPGGAYDFVKIKYGYGQHIIKNGVFQLPISATELVCLSDKRISNSIRNRLDYSIVPTGLILNRTAEVFYESSTRVMPTKIFQSGAMFGLWEIFDPPPNSYIEHIWNITAGARTAFALPKISNQNLHAQLQKHYKINSYQPSSLLEQQTVFSEISNSISENERWTGYILFFSKKWQPKFSSIITKELHNFWLYEAWRQSYNCRNNMSFDMAWELFSHAVTRRNIKPKPIIVNTLKHLISIQEGVYPGFAPLTNDDYGPIRLLEEAYLDIYKVKNYPTIMGPTHLSQKYRPVYYSLQLPSLIEYAPGSHGKNIITDFRELKILMDMLSDLIETKGEFKFFHSEADTSLNILPTSSLPMMDKNIYPHKNNRKLSFADHSPFLKGCVQISLFKDRTEPLITESFFG